MRTLKFKIKSSEKDEVSLGFISSNALRFENEINIVYEDNKSVSAKRMLKTMAIKLKANDIFSIQIEGENTEKVAESIKNYLLASGKILLNND